VVGGNDSNWSEEAGAMKVLQPMRRRRKRGNELAEEEIMDFLSEKI